MSTGADYVVPEGNKLYVWQRTKGYMVTENERSFNNVALPEAEFPLLVPLWKLRKSIWV